MKRRIFGVIIPIFLFVFAVAVEFPSGIDQFAAKGGFSSIPSPVELENEIDPDDYIVGVGDQFLIEKAQEQDVLTIPVLPTGVLSITGFGNIYVSGKTLNEALKMISDEIGPYNRVTLYNLKNIRIPMSGALINPGLHSVNASWRLSDLLRTIEIKKIAKDYAIEIRSAKGNKIVNPYEFYVKGNIEHNPYLHAGESVHIPYVNIEKECVNVNGPVKIRNFYKPEVNDPYYTNKEYENFETGIIPFLPGETLGDLQRRKLMLTKMTDLNQVSVKRGEEFITLNGNDVDKFELKAGDNIEYNQLLGVIVSGHVNLPGSYDFIPEHTISDYIAMAGGVTEKGSGKSAIIIRANEKIRKTENVDLQRGDIVLVKRSADNFIIGDISVLEFVSMLSSIAATLLTAYIAAGS